MQPYLSVEPARGETYEHPGFAVYRYDEYPPDSVLAGQERRSFVEGDFETEADALAKYPKAETGGAYVQRPSLAADAPAWFDPSVAGESWDGD
jgi:hypothetical protein